LTDNHDTPRFMGLKGATKEGAKLSLAFVLATRGIPQLYYGDEVLMAGGDDPFNRNDFTKFDKSSRTADEQEMFEWTQKWIKLRKENRALREGKTMDLYYDNEVYAFARDSVCKPICDLPLVFAFNNSENEKRVEISADSFLPKDGQKDGQGVIKTHLDMIEGSRSERLTPSAGKFTIKLKPKAVVVFRGGFMTVVSNDN
jgi:glycosidase